jgi:hypothetical protein
MAISAIVIAAATVSAAVLPMAPAKTGPVTAVTTWQDLRVVQVQFPDNLDIDVEAVYTLRTAAEWNAFWAQVPDVTVDGLAVGELPYVDFSHQFAVVASYGWHEEGYAISVTHAKFNGQAVYVQVDRQIPNPANCRPYIDPFFGGIAIIDAPAVGDLATTPVGASYNQVMEDEWDVPVREC